MAYEINYDDRRFQQVESDRKEALTENEQLYSEMINQSDAYYKAQIDAAKEWANTQTDIQNQQTEFAIEQVEQQKQQAEKDYTREQSGAYVDWQKQSNQYGANAETMAANGLAYSGYSESSQVSMFNTYQNRVATARESYTRAVLNYDNAIKEARLQNSSALAEIAYQSLQAELELALQGFQYKNQLLTEKANQKAQINSRYDTKWQNVLDQMNTENALQEELRQFNANYALEQQKYNESVRQFNAQLAEEQRQFNAKMAKSSSSVKSSSSKSSSGSSSGSSVNKTQTFTTYKEAAKYLQSIGATKGDGGLMTENEWKSRKARGATVPEVQYSSYSEYLNNFVAWKKDNPDPS